MNVTISDELKDVEGSEVRVAADFISWHLTLDHHLPADEGLVLMAGMNEAITEYLSSLGWA